MAVIRLRFLAGIVLGCASHGGAFSVRQLNARCRQRQHPLSYQRGDDQDASSDILVVASSLMTTLEQLVMDADQEWHDSFLRNGLADFVPPLAGELSCLVVGDDMLYQHDQATHQRLPYVRQHKNNDRLFHPSWKDQEEHAERHSYIMSQPHQQSTMPFPLTTAVATYDCIFDRGLLQSSLLDMEAEEGAKQATILLQQAARHLREHGIYVVTTPPLSDHVKDYLVRVGKELGLDWKFGLDGLSEEGREVAVARRYFTGTLPSIGKLASIPRP